MCGSGGSRTGRAVMAICISCAAAAVAPFRINCIDSDTGRGVPLVQLKTSNYISFYSDSAGIVAFDEPGFLDLSVYFVVQSDGYRVSTPALPNTPVSDPGVLLDTVSGGNATILLERTMPAERLFRLTGGGLYRDTVMVGEAPPVKEPLLSSAGVVGQDSLLAIVFKNLTYWFFGDSECPAGPRDTDCQHYGRFTNGATSPIAHTGSGGNPPSLSYYTSADPKAPGGMAPEGRPSAAMLSRWNPHGFSHPKAMLPGPGPGKLFNLSTWIGSLTVVTDVTDTDAGTDTETRMYCTYVCPTGGPGSWCNREIHANLYDRLFGVARWDESAELFRPVTGKGYKMRYSGAQAVQRQQPSDGGYVYYASAFAMSRVRATFAGIEDPDQYEYFTPCQAEDSLGCNRSMDASSWGWRRSNLGAPGGVAYFGPSQEQAAIKAGHLQASAARMQPLDGATGKAIGGILSRGSVNWNQHRQKYVLIADRTDHAAVGVSRFGEIYYCEADSITGPWKTCEKVITHNVTGTSCYNPLQLPWLDEGDGARIYIACTWTSMSSSKPGQKDHSCRFDGYGGVDCAIAVPRYEYNNMVFGLDVKKMKEKKDKDEKDEKDNGD